MPYFVLNGATRVGTKRYIDLGDQEPVETLSFKIRSRHNTTINEKKPPSRYDRKYMIAMIRATRHDHQDAIINVIPLRYNHQYTGTYCIYAPRYVLQDTTINIQSPRYDHQYTIANIRLSRYDHRDGHQDTIIKTILKIRPKVGNKKV